MESKQYKQERKRALWKYKIFMGAITSILVLFCLLSGLHFALLSFGNVVVCNPGVALGFFGGWGIVLGIVGFIALILLARSFWAQRKCGPAWIGFGMLVAGGAVNMLDRLRFGCVRDYFDFFGWFVFNVADIGIFLGGVMIGIGLFVWKK